jgi:hypothetical protein
MICILYSFKLTLLYTLRLISEPQLFVLRHKQDIHPTEKTYLCAPCGLYHTLDNLRFYVNRQIKISISVVPDEVPPPPPPTHIFKESDEFRNFQTILQRALRCPVTATQISCGLRC